MAAKRKASKAGAGAIAVGKRARKNDYVQRLVEDGDLRDDIRDAYESVQKAYGRLASARRPAKALMDDRKTQREIRNAAESLRDVTDALRGTKRKRRLRRRSTLVVLVAVGGAAALLASEGVRNKLLDAMFGAEEEFEYTSSTVPPAPSEPAAAQEQAAGTT